MESFEKQRATLHAGRCIIRNGKSTGIVYSSKHSDRNFSAKNAPHITAALESKNLYYVAQDDGTMTPKGDGENFAAWELAWYKRHYGAWLEKQNHRHVAAGHKSRERTMEQVITSARQAPREEILTIGNCKNRCKDESAFIKVVSEYASALGQMFPAVRVLDYSVHRDEEGANIHAHLRMTFAHTNANGDLEPAQTYALAEMGIEAPDPQAKSTKTNNALVTFTQQCRQLYVDIAEKYGFEIETEVATPSKISLNKLEYQTQTLKEENQSLQAERDTLKAENVRLSEEREVLRAEGAELVRERSKLRKRIDDLSAECSRLRGILRHLKSLFTPLRALMDKLDSIRLSPHKTLLDDILLSAPTAGSISALRELEREEFTI